MPRVPPTTMMTPNPSLSSWLKNGKTPMAWSISTAASVVTPPYNSVIAKTLFQNLKPSFELTICVFVRFFLFSVEWNYKWQLLLPLDPAQDSLFRRIVAHRDNGPRGVTRRL